tara:strand:- start:210 stop:956 length:747 start_codon:yes stop_codon:yes gene_type:complete
MKSLGIKIRTSSLSLLNLIFILIISLFLTANPMGNEVELGSIKRVSYQKGKFYKVTVSKDVQKIIQKSVNAISKKSGWLKKYMKNLGEAEAIPWHKNLGITKEEYEFLRKESYDHFSLEEYGETIVSVGVDEDEYKVKIEGPSSLEFNFNISRDLKRMTMKGFKSEGRFDERGQLMDSLVRGDGIRWKVYDIYELNLSRLTGKYSEITYLELENKKECAFSIKIKGANEGVVILNYHFMIKYPCIQQI